MNSSGQTRYPIHGEIKKDLPKDPGVYLFRDNSEKVIYVGKAKNLKNRVSSYFNSQSEMTPKTAMMMSKARYLEFILTGTENEAFILESTLIKKYMPRYNIVLRDDKQYPYLKIRTDELYPRLELVRRIKKDEAIYFGPYSSSGSVRNTIKLINRIFRLRTCSKSFMNNRSRPCLNYQLGRCLGPCTFEVPVEQYLVMVNNVRLFLEGRSRELVKQLERDMNRFAEDEKFEDAARVRDQIKAVEKTVEKQNVVSIRREDQDIIGVAQKNGVSQVVIFFSRKGVITGSRDFSFENHDFTQSEIIEAFIKQYYHSDRYVPKSILISHPIDELLSISDWLSGSAGKKITIHHPVRGKKVGTVNLAVKNAENTLARKGKITSGELLEMTKTVLKLRKIPHRMEAMDISNLQGNQAVGTIVAFVDGKPYKSGYRNYKIKEVDGIDDYGMMTEMITRRMSGDNPPDLFVIDGGKGHLQAVGRVIDELTGNDPPELVAIAKEKEQGAKGDKLYLPGRKNPLRLSSDHPVLLLLMGIRDEVHRRAVTYHRKLRKKDTIKSVLDGVPGIGPLKRRQLLKEFGSLEAVRQASETQLVQVRGITRAMAVNIKKFLLNFETSGSDIEYNS